MTVEKLSVVLELVNGQYNREAKQSADATGKIGNAAKGVTGTLGAMIGPAAIGGAILGLGKMALAAGENADRLFDLQAQTGLSTDALQEWEFVAKSAGATQEFFANSVKQVVRGLDGAIAGTGAASKAYDQLGVSVTDANGQIRAAGDITEEVIDRLAGMTNITERNALAQDIFGKKWEETVSVLDMGSEAISNLREEGRKGVVSAEALRNSDKFRETWQKFMATVGPKLNELLGKIAPALTEVADGAMEAVDALEPLIDALGWVASGFGDMNAAIEAGRESPSKWAQSWAVASDVGKGTIFGILGVIAALFDEENALKDNTAEVTGEISDSWSRMGATFKPIIGDTIKLLDTQAGSHRNVARAAESQRQALINLFNTQAAQLDPIANYLQLLKDNKEAQERLTEAQEDGETSAADLALAVIEAEQAQLRLAAAGSALTADQIQAYARILIDEFGHTEQQAMDVLEQLNLLDGWTGTATFTLDVAVRNLESAISKVGGVGGIRNDVIQVRAAGGPVRRGEPYIVGEQGPELFIPGANGTIVPSGNERITQTASSGSTVVGPTIIVQSPMREFRSDLQYATTIASVKNLVEAF